MKKMILIAAAFITLSVNAANDNPIVNENALKTFQTVFAHATDVQWTTAKENNEASFRLNNVLVRAVIDNKGRLIRTLRYYKEDALPANIRYELKKEFKKQCILNVTELTTANGVQYYVSLQDGKHLIKVVADADGDILNSRKYNRGDL